MGDFSLGALGVSGAEVEEEGLSSAMKFPDDGRD